MQHRRGQRSFKGILHAVTKEEQLFDAELQLAIQRVDHVLKMGVLSRGVGVFQHHSLAPGQ